MRWRAPCCHLRIAGWWWCRTGRAILEHWLRFPAACRNARTARTAAHLHHGTAEDSIALHCSPSSGCGGSSACRCDERVGDERARSRIAAWTRNHGRTSDLIGYPRALQWRGPHHGHVHATSGEAHFATRASMNPCTLRLWCLPCRRASSPDRLGCQGVHCADSSPGGQALNGDDRCIIPTRRLVCLRQCGLEAMHRGLNLGALLLKLSFGMLPVCTSCSQDLVVLLQLPFSLLTIKAMPEKDAHVVPRRRHHATDS